MHTVMLQSEQEQTTAITRDVLDQIFDEYEQSN